ncbi:uncharacterized protein LOC114251364 [Bombyx mandarina]|uniref:ribonuclease H n=1 Tax=Bombyx mandarina TaxID=7092 RepID=A0A6J2KIL8_BOMMA|nr:uncharacterized protein LOC114251364 [Bombyx mandarina]
MASLYVAKRGAHLPVLGDRDIERVASALERPHSAEQVGIELRSLVDEEQYLEHRGYEVRIFTDGSKIEGKVGAALSIWTGEAEAKTLKLALSPHCTVYQAELLALCEAANEISRRKENVFAIFSDSMAALQTVADPDSLHVLAVRMRGALSHCKTQGKSVSLFWIKAHAGLEGNERADALAKAAALRLKKKPNYDRCPVSFAKRVIRMDTLAEWDRRYSAEQTASVTKLYFPIASEAYRIIRKIEMTKEVAQAFTGHGGFSEYLARFKCKESPACICDPYVDESVAHVLLECPVFGSARFDLEVELGQRLDARELPNLMRKTCARNLFLKYAIKIIKEVNKRNK